ncbi:uncharacterized protein RJT21DRAFT_132891 [Scheffersomyces amazonensis]|uniref:uncharacterized protein n=1 Tax=Scheffersomyces amazonensis TaxID=1078765 RepID=UPI00315DF2FB
MKQPIYTQDTSYSSDSESLFSCNTFKAPERSGCSQNNHHSKHNSTSKELMGWASRLELESITLKDTINDEIVGTLASIKKSLNEVYSNLSKRIDDIESSLSTTKLQEVVNQLKHRNTTNDETLEEVKEELQAIVTSQASQLSINRTHSKEIQELTKAIENWSNIFPQIKLESEISTQQSVVEKTSQEVSQIKQYLQLLLPRVMGIENHYKQLVTTYDHLISTPSPVSESESKRSLNQKLNLNGTCIKRRRLL